ncbi:DUF6932 family protein [Thauera chlorobenzoica]|uniref:DUF6932 family protein n=1 Tax=Thauera chlorobenzoica TaxID=96773 RepID=UPI0008A09066|nr:hypothetical protein [Thauera chlorobenzoica]SEG30261.1 hypothetical protein SAMN05216242_13916 [Thauera chlorobenzoica]
MLPPFDPFAGHLPPGWHSATVEGFRQRCVDEFPPHFRRELQQPDAHRKRLFEGYLRLHEALSELSIPTEQWIGGYFVSGAPAPATIELVNFCDAQAYESLPAELRALIQRYFDGERTAQHCHCDSYMVTKGPPDHPCNADYLKKHNFWHKRLAYDRDKRPRGIIGITIEAALPEEATDAEA